MAETSHFAIVQYTGHAFSGWQRQPKLRTVQGVLEDGLERIVGRPVATNAAGRTDAGVHARGQVVSFEVPSKWNSRDLERALNAVTPSDLWIARVGLAPLGFHARKHASARRYRFVLGNDAESASPFREPYEWAIGASEPVDANALDAAANLFLGTHDFRAFSAAGQSKPHYDCTVSRSEWRARPAEQGFIFTIEADRFLHKMVRFIVGITFDVARGRRPLANIPALLACTNNQDASAPAPPQGLYMLGALYSQPELREINEFVDRQ